MPQPCNMCNFSLFPRSQIKYHKKASAPTQKKTVTKSPSSPPPSLKAAILGPLPSLLDSNLRPHTSVFSKQPSVHFSKPSVLGQQPIVFGPQPSVSEPHSVYSPQPSALHLPVYTPELEAPVQYYSHQPQAPAPYGKYTTPHLAT